MPLVCISSWRNPCRNCLVGEVRKKNSVRLDLVLTVYIKWRSVFFCSMDPAMAAHRDTAFREQQMLKLAKKAILDGGDFLSRDQIAQRLGLPPATLDKWEADGQIFSVQHADCSWFPKYVFQDCTAHRPAPDLKAILDVLRTKKMDGESLVLLATLLVTASCGQCRTPPSIHCWISRMCK